MEMDSAHFPLEHRIDVFAQIIVMMAGLVVLSLKMDLSAVVSYFEVHGCRNYPRLLVKMTRIVALVVHQRVRGIRCDLISECSEFEVVALHEQAEI